MWTFDVLDYSIINVLSDFKNLKIEKQKLELEFKKNFFSYKFY